MRALLVALAFVGAANAQPVFHAERYGTFQTAKVDNAPVIRQAVEAARAAGGGVVKLPAGAYWVAADANGTAINVPAGVTLDMRDTTLQLIETDRPSYQVLFFAGTEAPSGVIGGAIIGDRDAHTGKGGEWGMCISVRGAVGVTIKGTKVTNCWGDGIYVGADPKRQPSRRVVIEDVEAERNRRNNISIVAVDGFRLANTMVHGAKGALPEAGVDLEPNVGDEVANGEIINLRAERNNRYGLVFAGKRGPIRNIVVQDLVAKHNGDAGVWFRNASQVRANSITSTDNGAEGMVFILSNDVDIANYVGDRNGQSSRRKGISLTQSRGIVIRRDQSTEQRAVDMQSDLRVGAN